MLTNHDIKKNIPFCNNPAELLTWKHAFCEEFCNWSLSLENNMGIIERQSFYLSESNENILFASLCCLWSPREFELFNGTSFYNFLLVQKPHVTMQIKLRMCKNHGEAWETTNMAANLAMEKVHSFESKKRLFSALIRIFQRIWSVRSKRKT